MCFYNAPSTEPYFQWRFPCIAITIVIQNSFRWLLGTHLLQKNIPLSMLYFNCSFSGHWLCFLVIDEMKFPLSSQSSESWKNWYQADWEAWLQGKAMFVMQRLLNLTSDGDSHALLSQSWSWKGTQVTFGFWEHLLPKNYFISNFRL